MIDKAIRDAAFKAFKKRLKIYQADNASSSAPAAHLSHASAEITAIQAPDSFPQEVWDALVENGKLRKVGRNMYELAK